MIYCRRCDLTFCEKHLEHHIDDETHSLAENSEATFCCICTGLYQPVVVDDDE